MPRLQRDQQGPDQAQGRKPRRTQDRVWKLGWKCVSRGQGAELGGGLMRGQQDGPQEPLDLAKSPPNKVTVFVRWWGQS